MVFGDPAIQRDLRLLTLTIASNGFDVSRDGSRLAWVSNEWSGTGGTPPAG